MGRIESVRTPPVAGVRLPVVLAGLGVMAVGGALTYTAIRQLLVAEGSLDPRRGTLVAASYYSQYGWLVVGVALLVVAAVKARRVMGATDLEARCSRTLTVTLAVCAVVVIGFVGLRLVTGAASPGTGETSRAVDLAFVSMQALFALAVLGVVAIRARRLVFSGPAAVLAVVLLLVAFLPAGFVAAIIWLAVRRHEGVMRGARAHARAR